MKINFKIGSNSSLFYGYDFEINFYNSNKKNHLKPIRLSFDTFILRTTSSYRLILKA